MTDVCRLCWNRSEADISRYLVLEESNNISGQDDLRQRNKCWKDQTQLELGTGGGCGCYCLGSYQRQSSSLSSSTVLFASSFNQFTHNLISLLCLDHFCHSGQVICWWS
ncbi:hypothetical protein GQ457_01G046270 [Hibiscus cannabinus]